jgi:hypothetical protein
MDALIGQTMSPAFRRLEPPAPRIPGLRATSITQASAAYFSAVFEHEWIRFSRWLSDSEDPSKDAPLLCRVL